jgi:AAHS family benzoate transporter-like MFS transporter
MESTMNSTAPKKKSLLGIFVLCWLGLLADGYDLYVYGATLPGLIGVAPFNITPAAAGVVGSIALVGMLLGSLVVGTLTDRLGRRRIFISALALFSLAMLACSMAPTGRHLQPSGSLPASESEACFPPRWPWPTNSQNPPASPSRSAQS